jgi:hypothetical protein
VVKKSNDLGQLADQLEQAEEVLVEPATTVCADAGCFLFRGLAGVRAEAGARPAATIQHSLFPAITPFWGKYQETVQSHLSLADKARGKLRPPN